MARLLPILTLALVIVISLRADSPPLKRALPLGFVDLEDTIPSLKTDLRYFGADNFLGRPVDGYTSARAIATREVGEALAEVQQALKSRGLGLKVFDAYRPQRAVDQFVQWASDPSDQAGKERFYPNVRKGDLLTLAYIAEQSGHSRGSAVDLTLVDLATGQDLDMGSPYDLFDPKSHGASGGLSADQQHHRRLLTEAMKAHGFSPYAKEWWHFSLQPEPYPNLYFDFPIQ